MSSKTESNFSSTLKFTYKQIPNKNIWIIIFVILLVYVISGRLLPILFGDAVDKGVVPNNLSYFYKITVYFFIISLLRSLAGFILYYLVGVESNKIAYKVRGDLFDKVLNLPTKYFDRNSSGKILTRVANDTRSYQSFLGEGLIGIFINFFELISIIVALVYESYILSSVVLIIFPLSYFISTTITKKIEEKYFTAKNILSELNSYLADSLNGYSVIKGYGIFKYKYEKYKSQAKIYLDKQIEISKLFAILWPQIEFVQLLTVFSSFVIGAYLIPKNQLDPGQLISFTLLVQSIFHPLRFILERMNQIQNGITSAQRIITIHNESSEDHFDKNTSSLPNDFKPSIKIKSLHFSYEKNNSEKAIFTNYNLSIAPYTTTALVGRTGSGKTTLVSLLQRLYELDSGSIEIGGFNIKNIDRNSLRKHVCIVRQEDFIFQGSILENITLDFSNKHNLKKAKEALDFAKITKPLNYKVTTSGDNLSPGERQLISFARVFYHSPKILIFDEATSFIDESTEAFIQKKALELFKNRTVIVVAHKKTTIEMCDNTVSL